MYLQGHKSYRQYRYSSALERASGGPKDEAFPTCATGTAMVVLSYRYTDGTFISGSTSLGFRVY